MRNEGVEGEKWIDMQKVKHGKIEMEGEIVIEGEIVSEKQIMFQTNRRGQKLRKRLGEIIEEREKEL